MKLNLKTAAIIFIMAVACLGANAAESRFGTGTAAEGRFRTGTAVELSPSDAIQRIYFDHNGLMWICTGTGLKSYDGYSLKTYKSGVIRPQIFPNNFIMSVTADNDDHIYIGTREGIVRMNRRTDECKTYRLDGERQKIIYELYTTKDGTVWAGTDGGLSMYDRRNDRFVTFDKRNSRFVSPDGKVRQAEHYGVKSIRESNDGKYLYIGTWEDGLLRMRRGTNVFHQLPEINGMPNAYTLCIDSRNRLWVGTWHRGLVCIENPTDFRHPRTKVYGYPTGEFNSIYSIMEHKATGTIWMCSRYGTHILDTRDEARGFRKYEEADDCGFFANTNYMAQDKAGNIWLQKRFGQIRQIVTGESPFEHLKCNTGNSHYARRIITSVHTGDGRTFYASLMPYGLMKYDRTTGKTEYDREIPEFRNIDKELLHCAVTSILRRKNGDMLLGSEIYGLIAVEKDGTVRNITRQNSTIMPDNNVNTLMERRNGDVLIGTDRGIGVMTPAGSGYVMKISAGEKNLNGCDVRHIAESADGTLWISTENGGIIRSKGGTTRRYAPENGKLAVADVTACHCDSHGRIWAISASGGLFGYDGGKDRFEPVRLTPGTANGNICSINEDRQGGLWIASGKKLTRITFAGNGEMPQTVTYTKEDGLGSNIIFMPNCTAGCGSELFFGIANNIVAFKTQRQGNGSNSKSHRLLVTDIRIDDRPYAALEAGLRKAVSEITPEYTKEINIPSGVSKFSVEFALTAYVSPEENKYAYMLKGYNDGWQYRDAATRNATFENLPTGTYRLKIKASDGKGEYTALPYDITVRVLPPWWLAWWAYLVYIIIGIGSVWFAIRAYKQRLNTQNKLQMQVVFTNITHELLTPLAVISASIDNLRHEAPQGEHSYAIMQNNIDRLTRLLREILEVRKSQAGKLRLLAAAGDMSRIVDGCVKNVMPMAMKKNIRLTSDIGEVEGWFDKDKVDTVIYNLLSNALKYTPEGKSIHVALAKTPGGSAVLTVSDRGIGISKEKMKHLYQRFLDADHRKTKISGTGIGLSLVHTLVKLHHGEIDCQSKEGEGTTFTVTLPLAKSAYGKAERATENRITDIITEENAPEIVHAAPEESNTDDTQPKEHSILLVEDNAELLELMARSLRRRYNVYTAQDGSKALKKIAKKELDVVITDVVMPVMDGIELVREIKGNSDTAQLPVIMLTAKTENDDRNEAYRTGADDYITKPFRLDDLRLRIDNIIANRERIRQKFSSQTDIGQDSRHCSSPDELFLQKAIEAVRAHIKDSGYGREEFAADLCVSPSTLYNKLRALTGQNISGFISSIRMKTARAMIESNPHISVSELAAAVGFNTPNYFSKLFKQEYGMLPSELCEKLK